MEFMKQHRRAIYIALALCVVAAGVTGYLLTNRETPNQQASANQPVVDVKPPVVTPVTPDLPVQEEPQEDEEPPVEAVAASGLAAGRHHRDGVQHVGAFV